MEVGRGKEVIPQRARWKTNHDETTETAAQRWIEMDRAEAFGRTISRSIAARVTLGERRSIVPCAHTLSLPPRRNPTRAGKAQLTPVSSF